MATKTVQHFPYGGGHCRTIVTLKDFPVNTAAATAAGVALSVGAELYDIGGETAGTGLAAGGWDMHTLSCHSDMSLKDTSSGAASAADSPEVGIGTEIGVGAAATLGASTNGNESENITDGLAVTNLSGTYDTVHVLSAETVTATNIAVNGKVYLNAAATWTGVMAVGELQATGTIIVDWYATPGVSA